jgi:hypothetical protein
VRSSAQSGSELTRPAGRSRIIAPRRPAARSPGPRGPDEFSPIGARARKAARTSGVMWVSCQRISSLTTSAGRGPRRQMPRRPVRVRPYDRCPRLDRRLGQQQLPREPPHHLRRRHRRIDGESPRSKDLAPRQPLDQYFSANLRPSLHIAVHPSPFWSLTPSQELNHQPGLLGAADFDAHLGAQCGCLRCALTL